MKKILGLLIALLCSVGLVFTVFANPMDSLTNFLGSAKEENETVTQAPAPQSAEQGSGSSLLQPRQTEPDGPAEGPVSAEPEKPGIPKDSPVSTTGATYGYTGPVNLENASSEQVNLTEGEWDINDAQMIFWGGTVIQNGGSSSLAVHDSYIRGETAVETAPLAGNPGNLLVAGNIRTTLGVGNSENIYINSSVISRNWAALSTDAARPALEEGQKELSLYAYGSEALTMDGGYGGYSDLFCNLYSYGSHFQAAEIGIISGTYGTVTVGTIEDGEKNEVLASVLTAEDKEKRSDKQLESVVEGGRNALMIHSVNLPPYWEYEGYSQEELPLKATKISAHGSTLRTDLSLDKGVEYEPQKQAYIDHTKGSVILIKSTNADMAFDSCRMVPDEEGTGYLIQTVYNNDTMFMNAVPEGENYPGINISLRDMKLAGGIAHEDYQRDLNLVLAGTTLDGFMNEYDCSHWIQAAQSEGFTDYSLDESYNTHHGLQLTLQEGSVWTVTEESHLSRLSIGNDCQVIGIITVDGNEQPNVPGNTYEGKVVVKPGVPETVTGEEEPEAHTHNWVALSAVPPTCTEPGSNSYTCSICGETKTEAIAATGHNYIHDGGYPPTCTDPGGYGWTCTDCGDSYMDPIPAMGHDWQLDSCSPATCLADGQNVYKCTRCAATYSETLPAKGHNWVYQGSADADCLNAGYDVFRCSYCGMEDYFNYTPAKGHTFAIYPTPGAESLTHTYYCTTCGYSYTEAHTSIGLGYCPDCGYTGAFGKYENFHRHTHF